jgi:D-alanyl-D-alanine carboxypeptidase
MMNEKAKSLGALNSNFVNPHGLPDDNHYTTAYDMALITREAMKNETFRKITGTRTYQIPPTNKQVETRYLRNHRSC